MKILFETEAHKFHDDGTAFCKFWGFRFPYVIYKSDGADATARVVWVEKTINWDAYEEAQVAYRSWLAGLVVGAYES